MGSLWGHARKLGTRSQGRQGHSGGQQCPLESGGRVGIMCPESHCPQCSARARLARSQVLLPSIGIRPCWLSAQPGLALAPAWRVCGAVWGGEVGAMEAFAEGLMP